ncbi:MAG: hypothetical protein WDZ35_07860 [Crocinitomicaceae bacterium]
MTSKQPKISTLSQRILAGVKLATKKMLEAKSKNNGEVVLIKDGKVVVVPASQVPKVD